MAPDTQPYNYEGAAAHVVMRWADLCSTDTDGAYNTSSDWVMAYGAGNGTQSSYIQVGLLYRYGWSCIKAFAEVRSPTSPYFDRYDGCQTGGTAHDYTVESNYDPNGSAGPGYYLEAFFDSDYVAGTGFKRGDMAGSGLVHVAFDGETHYPESDMPGYGVDNKVTDMTSMDVQVQSDNNWKTVCGNIILKKLEQNDISRYDQARNSCNEITLWTRGSGP